MLRDEEKKEARVQVGGWRIRESLAKWFKDRTKDAAHGAETRLIEDALSLYRELDKQFSPHKLALQKFALEHELDWEMQRAEIYALAVRKGLGLPDSKKK